MSWAASKPAPAEPTLAGIDVSQEPTNQEAIVLTFFSGQATLPAHWVSPVYNQTPRPAPATNPGKK